ncbi:DUF2934 domain-containing protein [Methylophilus sp. TWE2]|uniref:DUF2934 domain-containing protein n=1 Tax=Methylophilus sp. TWE2 TaxID=1662285 RepID=UPI00067157EB|nr:DUF2934 domain-containing protein [Methylophilus sp. TWE2]AKR43647.1 hypothetical protein ACJ67_09570 [Methylophilus sp. TWE2]
MATSKTSDTSAKKSTAAKKAAPKTTVSKTAKPAATRKKTAKPTITTSEDRYKMIEVAAYYIAEKNGFGHDHLNYWLQAEKQIDHQLNA